METSLGAYVHIPFCIQRCHYCDFATYARDQIAPNDDYVYALLKEQTLRKDLFDETQLSTIYFGGGTPSLLSPDQIGRIIQGFQEVGYNFLSDIEITLEVNPATLDEEKCENYKKIGVNRISIGCQSFNDDYLKACNREHSAQDTRKTIELVKKYFDNYSLDLLFSLPEQGLSQLEVDLQEIKKFEPPHVSAYCLTVPEKHPMNQGRCSDLEQVTMFEMVSHHLKEIQLSRYEISNFSKPGYESRHNNLYWLDNNYWALGLSAHSYKKSPDWGYRFWNPSSYDSYMKSIQNLESSNEIEQSFHSENWEKLNIYESLTDYCHTHLRLNSGVDLQSVRQKYGEQLSELVEKRLKSSRLADLVENRGSYWNLTEQGVLVSNKVFSELLFS